MEGVQTARIVSIQVGMPKRMTYASTGDGGGSEWESGIYKDPVWGSVHVGKTHLAGDGQSDLVHHGGPDRAVLIYSRLHYPDWESQLGRELPPGAFGENFTVDQPTELEICLGDVWETDQVILEVSQPRLPCFKLARRLNAPGLNLKVMEEMKGGWYCRVLKEGFAEAGEELRLTARPHPEWTVAKAFHLYLHGKDDPSALRDLGGLECLSQLWKDGIGNRLPNS